MAAAEVERVLAAKTHYSTLGVPNDASAADISRAYRKLSMTLHPDKCQESNAETAFKRLSEAHTVLCDPLQRRTYDRENRHALHPRSVGGIFAPPPPGADEAKNSFRAQSHQTAPWADPYPAHVPKPVWESPEEILMREKAGVELDRRELQKEFNELQRDLHDERRAAKERTKKHDHELTVHKRLANEAKASLERVKDQWQQKIYVERQIHERQRGEMAARIRLLEAEVAELRSQLTRSLSGAERSSSTRPPDMSEMVSGPSLPPARAITKSVEKDEYGNYRVVERDANGQYVVSAERLAAERKHGSSHTTVGGHAGGGQSRPIPQPAAADESMGDGLVELLERLDLSQHRDTLEEEELFTIDLLRSMGPMLATNMAELGMDAPEVERLRQALGM